MHSSDLSFTPSLRCPATALVPPTRGHGQCTGVSLQGPKYGGKGWTGIQRGTWRLVSQSAPIDGVRAIGRSFSSPTCTLPTRLCVCLCAMLCQPSSMVSAHLINSSQAFHLFQTLDSFYELVAHVQMHLSPFKRTVCKAGILLLGIWLMTAAQQMDKWVFFPQLLGPQLWEFRSCIGNL